MYCFASFEEAMKLLDVLLLFSLLVTTAVIYNPQSVLHQDAPKANG